MDLKLYVLSILFIVSVNNIFFCDCLTTRTVPEYLFNCYKNGGVKIHAPHNVQLLVELISKIERNNPNYNVRTLSSSLLHGIRLDGIQRSPNVKETEHVMPYSASGFQFSKFSFLMDLLIPGENVADIRESLSDSELCSLHFLISSSVDPWERGDEGKICPLYQRDGPSVSDSNNYLPYNIQSLYPKVNRTNVPSSRSRCPIESGVIKTAWGDISPGTLIAGISAALEPQNVRIQDIFIQDVSLQNIQPLPKANVEDIETLKELKESLSSSDKIISNILAATFSGDIAEMAARQGPAIRPRWGDYKIGGFSKWNDTLVPRNHYLFSANDDWEITDAEIIAGIDGFIIANYISQWNSNLDRLRLSQIIEMYYSNYGVAFDRSIRACNRKQNMQKLYSNFNILEQTLNLVNVFWLRLSTVYITPKAIQEISNSAVMAFEKYWPTLIDKFPSCDEEGEVSQMDVVLVTDGTWTKYESEQIIAILSESMDISEYGSSMGVMHGNTADWIANPTHSVLQLFEDIGNNTNEWPNRLNLPEVLTAISYYLENKTNTDTQLLKAAGLSDVIIIAAPTTRWSQRDLDKSRKILESLRATFTDIYILYITPDKNGFQVLNIEQYSHSDMLIETSDVNVQEISKMIRQNFLEKVIPKKIVPMECQSGKKNAARLQFEDYIIVGQKIIYRIHPNTFAKAPFVNVQFQGVDQGDISVCVSRKYSDESKLSCKSISGQSDALFQIQHPCNAEGMCDPIYFTVKAENALIKCGDKDCRFPNQIRFFIRHDGLQCQNNSGEILLSNTSRIGFILMYIIVFYWFL